MVALLVPVENRTSEIFRLGEGISTGLTPNGESLLDSRVCTGWDKCPTFSLVLSLYYSQREMRPQVCYKQVAMVPCM